VCGIVGYVGRRPCAEILLDGLQRLEYRGYDSAGISLLTGSRIESVRAVGNLASLRRAHRAQAGPGPAVATAVAEPTTGIGHTRWATHGRVTCANAHPHSDTEDRVHIVLNGIVENHLELRERLAAAGAEFTSETDAEVVAHLIAHHYVGDLVAAVQRTTVDLSGHYAFVAMCADEPDMLVGTRKECPLVVGLGDQEQYIASAIPAFLTATRKAHVLREGEIAVLRPEGAVFLDRGGRRCPAEPIEVEWNDDPTEKDGFETFMLKEIHEQGSAVADTLAACQRLGSAAEVGLTDHDLRRIGRVMIVGCGTSYHAGLAGRIALERWARIPVEIDIASEFRYRDPLISKDTLVIGITQSGETADTLAAMRLARSRGATVLALTNVLGSQATREADGTLFTLAGTEVGVAATKTFVAQVAALYDFALRLAGLRDSLSVDRLAELRAELRVLPQLLDGLATSLDLPVRALAEQVASCPFFLYLGRLTGLVVALEGALKLKEISYIPTDAYAAGEMKHGPIALLGEQTPVVCVAIEPSVLGKLLSNVSEVRARGARVLAVAPEGSKEIAEHAEDIIYIPRADPLLQVVLAVVPLQLLAYYIARARGLNVDQPRNLAKTVTVE
jgi:glutamine---fructose-6-phosphate transaminase (isomerizing)